MKEERRKMEFEGWADLKSKWKMECMGWLALTLKQSSYGTIPGLLEWPLPPLNFSCPSR
jgi:hypothetical protein